MMKKKIKYKALMPEDVNGDLFGSMFNNIMKRIDKADPKIVEEACVRIKRKKVRK
jgi:hypothetical protein